MKMTVKKLLFLLLAGVFLLYGCGSGNYANDTPSEEDSGKTADGSMSAEPGNGGGSDDAAEAICAMVLVDPGGNRYFIDVNAGTFFTAPIPEEFTNADGEMLEESDLSAGDLVEIYGNGIMLESYPGQYPGAVSYTHLMCIRDRRWPGASGILECRIFCSGLWQLKTTVS